MLEKRSKTIAAIALTALAIASFQLASSPAYSEGLDSFGIEEIYPTVEGGNEWYVNMDDPRSDPNFRNLGNIDFDKNPDGSWRVSADQIRMEAWSQSDEKWLNIEITEYAKIESGSNKLLQMYSRGGHHTNNDQCLGSAYKARLYGDGVAAWNKEITHPAYAGNRGSVQVTNEALEDRWIGFKAVIYNFVEDGNTYVRLESFIDDDVTDSDGNLVVKNNWKLASLYEDRGGWSTNNSDFNPSCGRDRDEILTEPGGTSTQNIAAWRSDDMTWSFKYLSVREIDPSSQQPDRQAPSDTNEEPQASTIDLADILANKIAEKHVDQDATIESIEFAARKLTSSTDGMVVVAIVRGDEMMTYSKLDVDGISTSTYTHLTALFDPPVAVQGGFDVVIAHIGPGSVIASGINI